MHWKVKVILMQSSSWIFKPYFDGLVQERRNSSALALELHLSCTDPLIWHNWWIFQQWSTRKFSSTHPNNDFSNFFYTLLMYIMKFSLVQMAFLPIWDGWMLIFFYLCIWHLGSSVPDFVEKVASCACSSWRFEHWLLKKYVRSWSW